MHHGLVVSRGLSFAAAPATAAHYSRCSTNNSLFFRHCSSISHFVTARSGAVQARVLRVTLPRRLMMHQTPSGGRPMPKVPTPRPLPGVRSVLLVGSGKGGVGKSTVAANLAVALAQLEITEKDAQDLQENRRNLRVALLDADIHGPSIPTLMGLTDVGAPTTVEIPATPPHKIPTVLMEPLVNHGVKCMSVGFLVGKDMPLVWRGPMVGHCLNQLFREVRWGDVDVMVVDLPPGTGDVQISIAQSVTVNGAVIVSTPQDLALIDAARAINMMEKVSVPVFGIIENMSYHVCSNCGHIDHIFGRGGAQKEAERLHTQFLGEIPLHGSIRATSDSGVPIALGSDDRANAFKSLAAALWEQLQSAR